MRAYATIFLAASALSLALGFSPFARQMPSAVGDARYGCDLSFPAQAGYQFYDLQIPQGEHEALTFLFWMRQTVPTNTMYTTPYLSYAPGPVQYWNPDLTAGAWAHGTAGTNIAGAVAVTNFPFSGYGIAAVSNQWPRGVYTVDGWSSNAVTVSLGGTDYSFGPGAFNRNCTPGPSASAVLSGTGLVAVGVSRTPCHRFFTAYYTPYESSTGMLNATNGWHMCAVRVAISGTNHPFVCSMAKYGSAFFNWYGTNVSDTGAARFSSEGIYKAYMMGVRADTNRAERIFDYRSFSRWLTDAELERVKANAEQELVRRGLQ